VPVRLKDYEVTVLMESKQLVLVRPLERPYYYSASYTRVPKHTDWSGLTPAEKTRMAMDSSYLLELMLKRYLMNDTDLLLGEVGNACFSFLPRRKMVIRSKAGAGFVYCTSPKWEYQIVGYSRMYS